MSLLEKTLYSKKIRGIIRNNLGVSFIRSHMLDINIPNKISIHLFDYILYKRHKKYNFSQSGHNFADWLNKRELR